MTIPAEKVFKKIQELVNENPDSLLNFDQEQERAETLLEQQKKQLTIMQAINEQIKQLAGSQAAIDQIKQLKTDFNGLFEEYKQEYAALQEILLTLRVSYDTEKIIAKQYVINENEKIILSIVNEIER